MVPFEGDGEPGTNSSFTTLHHGERQLALDDASLYAAQHFGLEVNLDVHKKLKLETMKDSEILDK